MKIKKYLSSLALSGLLVLSVFGRAFAGWGNIGYGYPGGHMMGFGYMGGFMILFWGLLLFVLILLVRWVARLPQRKGNRQDEDKSPLDILKERLARGEIEIEEYRAKKQLLSEHT